MQSSSFMDNYRKQMIESLKIIHPNKTLQEIENVVDSEIQKWEENNTLKKEEEKYEIGWMDSDESVAPCSIMEILNYLEDSNMIISGSGSLYKQHDCNIENVLAGMVDMLLKTRKIFKKQKFIAKENGDYESMVFNDLLQLTYKILANSFYGASTEKNCIFFDNFFGRSITLTGRIIISTAIFAFESFSGNFYFENTEDLVLYIKNIIEEPFNKELHFNVNPVTKDQLIDKLAEKFEDNYYDLNQLKNIVNNLTNEQVQRIYYKNNYIEFMKNDFMIEKYSKIAGHIFMDPNDPEDKENKDHEPYTEFKNNLEEIWSYLSYWVLYNHLNIHRYEFAENHKRKTVLVIDTDSNFLYNRPVTNTLREMFPKVYENYEENKELKLSTINISMYFYTKLITEVYEMMGKMLNINSYDKRCLINMKNEFLFKRLEMTPNKKWYSGLIMMQEGVINDPPEPEIKGIPLRKVSLNKNVRNYFTKTLIDKILNSDEIDFVDIYKDFIDMENEIIDSLGRGEIKYSQPDKVKDFSAYAMPLTQKSVKGTMLWNTMFPDNIIQIPDNVNAIKLKPMRPEEFIERIPEEYRESVRNAYRVNDIGGVEGSKKWSDYDIDYICFPKKLKKIPDFLVDMIDSELMTKDAIQPILIIINSLGFKNLEISKEKYSTNVIEI